MPEPAFGAINVNEIEIDDPYTGAKATPDDTSLAERFRNRDNALKAQPVDLRVTEGNTTSSTYVTVKSLSIYVPNYKVGLNIRGQFHRTGGTSAEVQAQMQGSGNDTSDSATTTSTSYVAFDITITELTNTKGEIATFALQAKQTGGGTAYAKIDTLECRFIAVDE